MARNLCRLLVCGLVVLGLSTAGSAVALAEEKAQAFETRVFGTDTLIKSGDSYESKLTSASRTATSISFSFKTLYDLSLYLEEAGARKALEPFKGQKLEEALKKDDIHRAVVNGDFPKVIVMRFSAQESGKEIKQDLNEHFLHSPAYGSPEAKDFVNFFKGDYRPGDEVVIRLVGDRVLTTIAGREQRELRNPNFARALLAIWVGKDKNSGSTNGLLGKIGPLLE